MNKYHYQIMVRSKQSKGNKVSYLDNTDGEIILHRKSKNKGVTLEQIKEEIGIADFRFYQKLYKDFNKVGWLEGLIKLQKETYELTGGNIGWSPKTIEKILKLAQDEEKTAQSEKK